MNLKVDYFCVPFGRKIVEVRLGAGVEQTRIRPPSAFPHRQRRSARINRLPDVRSRSRLPVEAAAVETMGIPVARSIARWKRYCTYDEAEYGRQGVGREGVPGAGEGMIEAASLLHDEEPLGPSGPPDRNRRSFTIGRRSTKDEIAVFKGLGPGGRVDGEGRPGARRLCQSAEQVRLCRRSGRAVEHIKAESPGVNPTRLPPRSRRRPK